MFGVRLLVHVLRVLRGESGREKERARPSEFMSLRVRALEYERGFGCCAGEIFGESV